LDWENGLGSAIACAGMLMDCDALTGTDLSHFCFLLHGNLLSLCGQPLQRGAMYVLDLVMLWFSISFDRMRF
jgi:hypothetical protein